MEKVGVDKYVIQFIYVCKYYLDKDVGCIIWELVKGEGNGVVCGFWIFKVNGDFVIIVKFQIYVEFIVLLLSLLKLVISLVIKYEFNSFVDIYMKNFKLVV